METGTRIECPKCGKGGSYQLLPRKNAYGMVYHYWYVGHYQGLGEANGAGVKTRKVKWCYIGKRTPRNTGGLSTAPRERS